MFETPSYRIVGDRGLLVEYGGRIDLKINRKVRAMAVLLDQSPVPGIIEVIPTYRSIPSI